jgi:hypothetical protein
MKCGFAEFVKGMLWTELSSVSTAHEIHSPGASSDDSHNIYDPGVICRGLVTSILIDRFTH